MCKCKFVWGIYLVFLSIPGLRAGGARVKKASEVKDAAAVDIPVDWLGHSGDDADHQHKQKISWSQLQTLIESQFYQQGFDNVVVGHNQFDQPVSPQDEEERYFSAGDDPTTINPDPFTTAENTPNLIEQQSLETQRHFQEKIANQAVRELQERSLGSPPTPSMPDVLPAAPLQLYASPFAESYANIRTLRRARRSINQHLAPTGNEIDNYFTSTAGPQSLVNSLLPNANPRHDLAQIGSWLLGNLAKRLEKSIASRLAPPKPTYPKVKSSLISTELPPTFSSPAYQSSPKVEFFSTESPYSPLPLGLQTTSGPESTTPRPNYSTIKSSSSTELPSNLIPLGYSTTPQIDPRQVSWNPAPTNNYDSSSQGTLSWSPAKEQPYSEAAKLNPFTTPIPTYSPNAFTWTLVPSSGLVTDLPKIRNVQILPTAHPVDSQPPKPYDNSAFQAYQQIYNVDRQPWRPVAESTTTYSQPPSSTPATENGSIMSLFKSKLRSLKQSDSQTSLLDKGYTEFQQPNQFFDLLQRLNLTQSQLGTEAAPQGNLGTAIFIKMPETEPTSTAGYLFDKTITSSKSSPNKKESYAPKKNNRSAQILKSTLVYRTPPGKRAIISKAAEGSKEPAADVGLFANLLESDKPISWLLGQPRQPTPSRPFVSALLNFIQKRSSAQ